MLIPIKTIQVFLSKPFHLLSVKTSQAFKLKTIHQLNVDVGCFGLLARLGHQGEFSILSEDEIIDFDQVARQSHFGGLIY